MDNGDCHLDKRRACPSDSKRRKKAKEARMTGRICSQVKKHSSYYFTVVVKSSGDTSAEPVGRQKIEEHVVTDLDLRNDENRPSLTSSASKNTIDERADAITGGNDIGPSGQPIYHKKCGNIG